MDDKHAIRPILKGRPVAFYALTSLMIIVVFTAVLGELDEDYSTTSAHLRAAAFEQFGCLDFKSVEQDGEEVTYSVWPDQEHVQQWKAYAEHLRAQHMAAKKWYKSYQTFTANILRHRKSG